MPAPDPDMARAERRWADALVATGGDVGRTVRLVAENARRAGFRLVESTGPDVPFQARRDDLCVVLSAGPDPFGREPGALRPSSMRLSLSYC